MGEPGSSYFTLVDHVNRLVCDLSRFAHAVIIFNHIHRDVHAQHTGRAQYQIPHPDIRADGGQPRALRSTQQAIVCIDHEPTLVIL